MASRQRFCSTKHRVYAGREAKRSERVGATTYSRGIQDMSWSIADICEDFTDEQLREALGAAQFLYELLRGETILRKGRKTENGS